MSNDFLLWNGFDSGLEKPRVQNRYIPQDCSLFFNFKVVDTFKIFFFVFLFVLLTVYLTILNFIEKI